MVLTQLHFLFQALLVTLPDTFFYIMEHDVKKWWLLIWLVKYKSLIQTKEKGGLGSPNIKKQHKNIIMQHKYW